MAWFDVFALDPTWKNKTKNLKNFSEQFYSGQFFRTKIHALFFFDKFSFFDKSFFLINIFKENILKKNFQKKLKEISSELFFSSRLSRKGLIEMILINTIKSIVYYVFFFASTNDNN